MSNESINDLWNKAKDLLKEETTVITYETWIQPLELKSINDNIIVLTASNSFQRDTVESRYIDLLTNTFNFITNKKCKIFIKLDNEENDVLSQIPKIGNKKVFLNSGLNSPLLFVLLELVLKLIEFVGAFILILITLFPI